MTCSGQCRRNPFRQFLDLRVWVLALFMATLFIVTQNLFFSRPQHGSAGNDFVTDNAKFLQHRQAAVIRDTSGQNGQQISGGNVDSGGGSVPVVNSQPIEPYHLGCWLVQKLDHIKKSMKMSPVKCARHCERRNNTYAIITDGDQCACANHLQDYLTGSDCTRKCAGDNSHVCGGLFTSSVYAAKEAYPTLPIEGAPRKVLLLAYMRTGSTFTSQMFNMYADSFYIFEPFFRLAKYQHLSIIQNLLSCQFSRVPKDVFLYQWSYWHRRRMQKSLSHFFTCMDKLREVGYYRCLPLATLACEKSTLRIIKEIEINMKSAVTMQKAIPDLYVFHLVRDPRAVTNSRLHVHERNTPKHLVKYCGDVKADLEHSKDIPSENLFFLQYEKITEHPLETVESLYNFINMTVTQGVLDWVKFATGMTDPCKGLACVRSYSTVRKNSSSTAYKWKKTIPWKIVKYIDQSCSTIYGQLGYLPIHSEGELRNPLLKHRTW